MFLFQTAVLPELGICEHPFDFNIAPVLFLVIYRPVPESFVYVCLSGIVLDNMAGYSLSIFGTTYLLILLFIRWLARFIRVTNWILLPFATLICVSMENILVVLAAERMHIPTPSYQEEIRMFLSQATASVFIAPALILIIRNLHRKITKRLGLSYLGNENGNKNHARY